MTKRTKTDTDQDQADGLPVEASTTAMDPAPQDAPVEATLEVETAPELQGTVYAVFSINEHMTLGLWRLLDDQLPDEGLDLPEADRPPARDSYMRVAEDADLAMARDLIKTR